MEPAIPILMLHHAHSSNAFRRFGLSAGKRSTSQTHRVLTLAFYAQALTLAALPALPLTAMAGALEALALAPPVLEAVPVPEALSAPYLFSNSAVVGSVVLELEPSPYAAFSMEVVVSAGGEGALFEVERLSRSSTHCTVWATAVSALATACEGVDFRSLATVA